VRGQRPAVETIADERIAIEIMIDNPLDNGPTTSERLDDKPSPDERPA